MEILAGLPLAIGGGICLYFGMKMIINCPALQTGIVILGAFLSLFGVAFITLGVVAWMSKR
jgi:hypothetical protein